MAVTETVKIVFEVDNKDVAPSFDDISKKIIGVKDETAKLTAENKALKKSIDEAFSAGKNVDDLKKKLIENEAAIRASKRELGDFQKTIDNLKSKPVEGVADGFVSLRSQVKEAKEEVQRLSDKFGEFSPQANAARARAGELADKMSDLNRQVGLLNPEAKIKAFTALGQGIVGSFQLATGALQAFGSENEEVQKIAQKLQGALNVVQGLQSISQLKEAYQDVKVVLGFTATAQQALNVAQVEGAAASGAAATGLRGVTAALAGTGIGAIVVAVGALAGAMLLLSANTEKEVANEKALKDAFDANKTSADNLRDATNKLAVLRGQKTQEQVQKENLIIESKKRQIELEKVLGSAVVEQLNAQKSFNELTRGAFPGLVQERKARLDAANAAVNAAKEALKNELLALDFGKKAIDLEKQKQDASNKSAANSKKNTEQTKKQAEVQKDVRKEIETTLIPSSKLEEQVKDINKELEDTGKMAKRSLGDWKGSAQELIDKEEELMQKQKEKREIYFAVASELSQLALIGIQNQTDAEIEALETRKEAGLVSEEEYQKGIKKLRQKAAEDQKKAAIFQATLDLAAALINALTFKPSNAVPAALILATVTATANLAKIIATPIPKFNKGTLSVPGIDTGGDSVMAMLRPGEAVIPTDTNRSYAPSIKAIYQKQIKPSEINAFVLNKLSGRGSIGRDTAITASVDTFALSKAMNKNRAVEVTNANIVGKVIANEMMKAYNPRR